MYTVRMANGSASANTEQPVEREGRQLELEVGNGTGGFTQFARSGPLTRQTVVRDDRVVSKAASAGALLEQRVREAAAEKLRDWDELVQGGTAAEAPWTDADAWGAMPAVDSKFVVELSPIFEEVLGCELNVKLIRPGGYASVDDMVADLIPKAVEDAARRPRARRRRRRG